MSRIEELVPPWKLCKLIPKGEFEDSCFQWAAPRGAKTQLYLRKIPLGELFEKYPAPTLEEILEELRKNQEDVFLKWSPKAYHSWLVNAYTHDKEDYQDHNSSAVTAALTVWLKLKGVNYESSDNQHKA